MFQLASVTITTHLRQLCGSCDADKTRVLLTFIAKISDRYLEQRIDITFCVNLRKNVVYACELLFEA